MYNGISPDNTGDLNCNTETMYPPLPQPSQNPEFNPNAPSFQDVHGTNKTCADVAWQVFVVFPKWIGGGVGKACKWTFKKALPAAWNGICKVAKAVFVTFPLWAGRGLRPVCIWAGEKAIPAIFTAIRNGANCLFCELPKKAWPCVSKVITGLAIVVAVVALGILAVVTTPIWVPLACCLCCVCKESNKRPLRRTNFFGFNI